MFTTALLRKRLSLAEGVPDKRPSLLEGAPIQRQSWKPVLFRNELGKKQWLLIGDSCKEPQLFISDCFRNPWFLVETNAT